MPNKGLAKRAAHLEVCRLLYERGALDDNLVPMRKGLSSEILKCLDLVEVEGGAKVGTKHKVGWYEKKVCFIDIWKC